MEPFCYCMQGCQQGAVDSHLFNAARSCPWCSDSNNVERLVFCLIICSSFYGVLLIAFFHSSTCPLYNIPDSPIIKILMYNMPPVKMSEYEKGSEESP